MTMQTTTAPRPHHFDELYPGRFLKGTTLDKPRTIRIVSMVGEELEGDKGKKLKGVLTYKGQDENGKVITAELVLNKTNAILISKMFDEPDYTKWGGHLITIYFDKTVQFGAERKGGIRICGSPELKKDLRVEITRPRRKTPEIYNLKGTKSSRPAAAPDPNLQAQIAAIRETGDIEQLDEVLGNIALASSDEGALPGQLQAVADSQREKLSKTQ